MSDERNEQVAGINGGVTPLQPRDSSVKNTGRTEATPLLTSLFQPSIKTPFPQNQKGLWLSINSGDLEVPVLRSESSSGGHKSSSSRCSSSCSPGCSSNCAGFFAYLIASGKGIADEVALCLDYIAKCEIGKVYPVIGKIANILLASAGGIKFLTAIVSLCRLEGKSQHKHKLIEEVSKILNGSTGFVKGVLGALKTYGFETSNIAIDAMLLSKLAASIVEDMLRSRGICSLDGYKGNKKVHASIVGVGVVLGIVRFTVTLVLTQSHDKNVDGQAYSNVFMSGLKVLEKGIDSSLVVYANNNKAGDDGLNGSKRLCCPGPCEPLLD